MNSKAYHLGLIGYPLTYSLSPRLHQAALQACAVRGEYRLYPVPPLPQGQERLRQLLQQMRQGRLHGLNVTIPHKQTLLPYLDDLTLEARAIGAVNTLLLHEGLLVGDNTDAAGFWRHLISLPNMDEGPKTALILGAGGAARAVAFALLKAGWSLRVAARRLEQAQRLVQDLTQALSPHSYELRIKALPLEQAPLRQHLNHIHLIVNATPVGMPPDLEQSPWPPGLPFPPQASVYDLIYHPPQTRLLHDAQAAGLQTVNGLGMLVEQAALAFERWTGVPAPRQQMHRALSAFDPVSKR